MFKVKFIHIRRHETNGSISPLGGGTVAYEVDSDTGMVSRAASSFCHPRDNFSRHLGRVKAQGRLNSKHWVIELGNIHERDFVAKIRSENENLLDFSPRIQSSETQVGLCDC